MTFIMEYFTIPNVGLLLSAAGSILVAAAFGKYPTENAPCSCTIDEGKKGKIRRRYIAHFNHPILFQVGLAMLCIGMLMQIQPKAQMKRYGYVTVTKYCGLDHGMKIYTNFFEHSFCFQHYLS